MKKKKDIVIIFLSVTLLLSLVLNLCNYIGSFNIIHIKNGFFKNFYGVDYYELILEKDSANHVYVTDAKTAVNITKAIFNLKRAVYIVDYDEENQLWLVDYSSLFSLHRKGGGVVIQKSDGKIVHSWGKKA